MPITDALEKTLMLMGVTYKWNDENKCPEAQLGLIAQEVEKIIPEVVNTDENGYMSIQYSVLVALLIEAIKEQEIKINKQNAAYEKLAVDIEHLREKLNAMNIFIENIEKQRAPSYKYKSSK